MSLLVWLAFGAVALVPAMMTLTGPMVLADGAVRDPQPHGRPDGAGRGRARRRTARLGDGRPGGLVRPQGLASVVFALLALEELGSPTAGPAVAVIAITVLLSVAAHGATAQGTG